MGAGRFVLGAGEGLQRVVFAIASYLVEGEEAVDPRKSLARLGRLLSSAAGYEVRTTEGHRVGRVEHVRYERHADRPDEIVVRVPGLLRRRRSYPLRAVCEVRPKEQLVVIDPASDRVALETEVRRRASTYPTGGQGRGRKPQMD